MSLRLHVIQAITLVLLGTLVVGALFIYWHSVRKIETEMSAAIAVGGRVARNAVDDIGELANPRRRLILLVADYDGDRHLRATLFSAQKGVIARSKWSSPERPAPEWLQRLFARPPRITIMKLPAPLARYGQVVLQTDPSNELAEVWADAKLYLMLLASFCAAVLTVLYFVLGRILKPLQSLLLGFEEIGKGDRPEPISVSGPAELCQLAQGFNDMTDHLVGMKDRNARLREQLETVQEEERAELARNLHDEVSPLLFSVDVDATNVAHLVAGGESERVNRKGDLGSGVREKVRENADSIKAAVSLLKRNVKAILVQLRPAGLHALSLKNTIEDLTTFWNARKPKLQITVSVPEKSWGVKIDSAVQSIVRESLSNVMKHSEPTQIDVTIKETSEGTLIVEIADNGGGISASGPDDGLGIIGMRERAVLLGGNLTVEDRHGPRGVVVRARLPISTLSGSGVARGHDGPLAKDAREEEELA